MADYTRRDSGAMRRDAQRRAQQMKQRVPYIKQTSDEKREDITEKTEKPFHAEETVHERDEYRKRQVSAGNAGMQMPFGIDKLLGQLDSDRMLILALLAMLYKDGGNKKLMMALAYLLT